MGNKRKQARRAARQALKSKPRIHGYEIDTIIVDELAAAPALPPKPKRDNSPIEARNEAQAHYLISLDTKPLTFATGEAGCGKTYLAAAVAAQRLLDKEVGKIIVTRPVLQAEEDLGFLPGDMSEKFAPFFRPVYDVLQKRLGGSFLEYCLKPEVAKVEIAPFAYMRGRTFENAVVIVNGDVTQCDLPGNVKSGLEDALERFKPSSHVGLIEFATEDCVRSELCKVALEAYQ